MDALEFKEQAGRVAYRIFLDLAAFSNDNPEGVTLNNAGIMQGALSEWRHRQRSAPSERHRQNRCSDCRGLQRDDQRRSGLRGSSASR
jgi:hypothetical protein